MLGLSWISLRTFVLNGLSFLYSETLPNEAKSQLILNTLKQAGFFKIMLSFSRSVVNDVKELPEENIR